ncbi:ATP-binding protein [Paractinoplanes maris]|uniref:ATP-binding protein n=1 Tax=Paractinoplanes maris TaxID=1734446 RepID=UPI0020202FD5|nr:tetratricopeptide repeat protein [Actinoplanes maris]
MLQPEGFGGPPDPGRAGGLDDVAERLRLLKVWGGNPSYDTIKERVNAAWTAAGRPATELTSKSTVADCFRAGRRRLNADLVIAVVEAVHPDAGYVALWRQALRAVGGEIDAVSQVRVHDTLPQDLAGFTGRTDELERLRLALSAARRDGGAVVISAIAGMAGVGKTQLAVRAGHLLAGEGLFDRVLFVNLRGFDPDPAQPPADPAAVLDGFLRVLGVSGHRIPHGLEARAAAYRARLAGTRALVVLDNAATVEQVRPLLPDTPGCLALVTSRRSLSGLPATTALSVDVFTPDEAVTFLRTAVAETHRAPDPAALARIAARCGYLPLALSLVAGHIRGFPDWTLADQADRLDDRHRGRRLESGVELALDLSYQDLPAARQRLLRLVALHPGQDFDAYAAGALTGTEPAAAATGLEHLVRDHLLQPTGSGRFGFHDLVRLHATDRALDQDPPAARRAALDRLSDYYLATAGAAMNALHPGEAHERPPRPADPAPGPELTDPEDAVAWLDTERPTLIAVVAHAATHGSPARAVRLARTLSRYLKGGHHGDALTVHGHALRAAHDLGDLAGQAHSLTDRGVAHRRLGLPGQASDDLQRALELFRLIGDPAGQAAALYDLGTVVQWMGRYQAAIDYKTQALDLYRQAGDRNGEANMLSGIGLVLERAGRFPEAIDHCEQALVLHRQSGNRHGEAQAFNILGDIETRAGRYDDAAAHLTQARTLFRQLGNRNNEAGALDSLGMLSNALGRPEEAIGYLEQSLTIFRELGNKGGETGAVNLLGRAALAAGRPTDALAHHTAALALAVDAGLPDEQAFAEAGLGHLHRALGDHARAAGHFQRALTIYLELGLPEADEIRAHLAVLAPHD